MTIKIGVILPTSTPDPAQPILGDVRASARLAEETGLGSPRQLPAKQEPSQVPHERHRRNPRAIRPVRTSKSWLTTTRTSPPDRLDQEHIAHLVFLFEDGGRIEPREHRIGFHPFTLGELRERLEVAGLREVDTDFDDGRDRYAVTAVPAGDTARRSWPRNVA